MSPFDTATLFKYLDRIATALETLAAPRPARYGYGSLDNPPHFEAANDNESTELPDPGSTGC